MLAATVSSPPSDTDDTCFGAAIIHSSPNIYGRRDITFWLMGSRTAMASITPDPRFTRSRFFQDQEMEDHIAEHFVCKPTLHQGALRVREEWRRFMPQHNPRPTAARYHVQSREQLLMVVKSHEPMTSSSPAWMSPDPPAHDGVGGPGYPWAWTPVSTLPGRMLFVGRGCSRSYEVAAFPGFQEGIYFLDDEDSYDVPRIVQRRTLLCLNNGKWSAGQAGSLPLSAAASGRTKACCRTTLHRFGFSLWMKILIVTVTVILTEARVYQEYLCFDTGKYTSGRPPVVIVVVRSEVARGAQVGGGDADAVHAEVVGAAEEAGEGRTVGGREEGFSISELVY
uniref:KIB1-4 beta-propeller domain-containing protein n=1 Tax=Oryza punctata TaxID=4537 RepID=A0A0E0L5X8_ORYPU